MSMKVQICGEEYIFTKDVRENAAIRESFCKLSNETFGLDFPPWYESGGWGDDYQLYVLIQNGEVVANVSVNRTALSDGKEEKLYIQIGTVMTRPDKRKRGLGRFLMEKVLEEWKQKAAGIYLFGNDSAKDYYPLFGFEPSYERVHTLYLEGASKGQARRLNMENAEDRKIARAFTTRINPYAALDMRRNPGLLWFYFSGPSCGDVYYVEGADALLVQYMDGDTLFVDGIYGGESKTLSETLKLAALPGAKEIQLGFTPLDTTVTTSKVLEVEDQTLFVLKDMENPFGDSGLRLPALAHA